MDKRLWLERIPHALFILFVIIIFVAISTHFLPSGVYERIKIDGRLRVVPNSYHTMTSQPISFFQIFKSIPLGFKSAVDIIFIVFAGGIMFGIIEKTTAIENAIGTLVKRIGLKRRNLIVVIMTFIYGFLGIAVGYENNIALVPIAAVLSLAIGGDLVLAAGISVGAMTVGFGLSPINPYTVGTGHNLAALPLFSGSGLRSMLCFLGLSMMAYYNVKYFQKILKNPTLGLGQKLNQQGFSLSKPINAYKLSYNNRFVLAVFIIGMGISLFGIFNWGWYIQELSALFIMIAIACGIVGRININDFSHTVLDSVSKAAPGAFMVGFATSIKVLMEQGNISDTISYYLAQLLNGAPTYLAAIGMSLSQCFINFFIPSGSGQALATLPVMLPLGEVLGLTDQTTILAFQIGDGLTNLVNPTLGGLLAMISMCRVPLDKWLRYILPLTLTLLILAWCFLILAVAIGY